jgi:hypothetical protein
MELASGSSLKWRTRPVDTEIQVVLSKFILLNNLLSIKTNEASAAKRRLANFLRNEVVGVPPTLPTEGYIVPELQKIQLFLTQRPGYEVQTIEDLGHTVILRRELVGGWRNLCMLTYQPTVREPWNVVDSEAFLDSLSYQKELPKGLHLVVVVLQGKVSMQARNAGFDAEAKCRVLPLSIADIDAVNTTPEARRRAPKVVDAAVVMKDLGYDKVDDLVELMPLSVADPAILWDLDLLIGSYVHMPLSHSSYRIVSSAT